MKPNLIAFLVALSFPFITPGLAEPVPEGVKKAVTFIFLPDQAGHLQPNGTAFFVSIRNHVGSNALTAPYLITAKHVVSTPDQSVYPLIFLRANTKSGSWTNVAVPLITQGPAKNVYFHEDPDVDLAVIAGSPPDLMDFQMLDSSFLTTEQAFKSLKIGEGTDVFFVGLFHSYLGYSKNYPLARFGKVALVTDEKIDWPQLIPDSGTNLVKHVRQNFYLIESTSIGGFSGSPVFFTFTEPGTPKLKLAGVMEGFFNEFEPIVAVQTGVTPFTKGNSGIAAVIPAYRIYEILFGTELTKSRGF